MDAEFFSPRTGQRIYYEVYYPNSLKQEQATSSQTGFIQQTPLILLHGLGSATAIWRPQLADLPSYHPVIALDYPGHGKSDWGGEYSFEAFTQIVLELMDHIGISQAHLLGLSIGCNVALQIALQSPERIASLILESPSGGLIPLYQWPQGLFKSLLLHSYLNLLHISRRLIGQERTAYLIDRFGPQTYEYYPLLKHLAEQVDPRAVYLLTLQNAYPSYMGNLEQITAPVLIIRGKGDLFPRRYAEYIRQHVQGPCEYVELPGGRHIIALEQPIMFNWVVLQFLKSLTVLDSLFIPGSAVTPYPSNTNVKPVRRPSQAI